MKIKKRQEYSQDFKEEVLKSVLDGNMTAPQAIAHYKITSSQYYTWRKFYNLRIQALNGSASNNTEIQKLEAEMTRLLYEANLIKEVIEILKKRAIT